MSDVVAVMYLGRIVEQADTDALFESPRHPYTQGLIGSLPTLTGERLRSFVAGDVPDPRHPPRAAASTRAAPSGRSSAPTASSASSATRTRSRPRTSTAPRATSPGPTASAPT